MAELNVLVDKLAEVVRQGRAPTTRDLDDVLRRQVQVLDQLFNALGQMALATEAGTAHLDMLKVALRAQAQCAMTTNVLKRRANPQITSQGSITGLSDVELIAITQEEVHGAPLWLD